MEWKSVRVCVYRFGSRKLLQISNSIWGVYDPICIQWILSLCHFIHKHSLAHTNARAVLAVDSNTPDLNIWIFDVSDKIFAMDLRAYAYIYNHILIAFHFEFEAKWNTHIPSPKRIVVPVPRSISVCLRIIRFNRINAETERVSERASYWEQEKRRWRTHAFIQCNRTNPPFIRINRTKFRMKILLQNATRCREHEYIYRLERRAVW